MQIIQTIRDKGAAIVIIVISLSLIGFILMDANQGGGMFSSSSTDIGKVNGENIEFNEFNKRVRMAESVEEQRTGQRVSGVRTFQLRDDMWNQVVAEKVFSAEAEKLGIAFTAKELAYILLSNEPNNPFLQEQQLRDPETGKLNVAEAQKAIANIKKFKGEQLDNVNAQIIEPLQLSSMVSKYTSMLNASVYYPSWMQKKEAEESKTYSSISYVAIPYSEISDSTVKVTDEDINEYVKKNKGMFKQEEGRMISYLTFSQLPNAEDSARTEKMIMDLKSEFAADSNATAFILRNTSAIEFKDEFQPKSKFNPAHIDSIVSAPHGTVYGPYIEGNNIVLAKVMGSKLLPDSVKARHILIPLTDMQTGQQLRDDSTAKQLADSILNAVKAGADFAALAAKYSSDGSKDAGGDLGTFAYGAMVPEFNEYTFTNPAGSKGVVKTQFGYHVIDIISQKENKPAYKIAFMAKEILPGDATINAASLNATKASALQGSKNLSEYAAKNGLGLTQAPSIIKENDYMVGGLQDARQLVRWAFEAKVGEVSEPFSIGDNFVVASVDKVYKEGLQDAATARSGSEAMIRNQKKAEIIIKKIGNNTTLEAAATAYNKQVQQAGADSSLTFSSQLINGIGMEPKVIGASFHKGFQEKPSPAFGGTTGVFVIKINGFGSLPAHTPEEAEQVTKSRIAALRNQNNGWYEALRKQATIKDKRSIAF